MCVKFKRIITMIVQTIMLVGEVFQICKLVSSCGDDWGASFQEFVCVYGSKGSLQ